MIERGTLALIVPSPHSPNDYQAQKFVGCSVTVGAVERMPERVAAPCHCTTYFITSTTEDFSFTAIAAECVLLPIDPGAEVTEEERSEEWLLS